MATTTVDFLCKKCLESNKKVKYHSMQLMKQHIVKEHFYDYVEIKDKTEMVL